MKAVHAVATLAADTVELPAEVISYLAGRTAGGVKNVIGAARQGWNTEPLRRAA